MTIKTDISPVLGFARMQSGIRTVRSIVLKNTSGTELKDVKVEIRTDPAFAHGTTVEVGTMNPKGRQVLGNVDIALSHEFLANLSETLRGTVNISVTAVSENDERIVVAEETKEVEVLPYDEWEGLPHMPELVASFVLPNHPVVKNILSTASDIMRQMTGDPSLGGYINSTPERVYMQMEAIYRAVSTLRIAYSNAPASFQKDGQRIRMPEEIISNLLATCMDSALLYSACLEAAGIHPVMVFTTGHAFSGAWLVPESHPYAVCDDVTTLSKHVADGINDLVLVETTGSDEGNDRTFSEAVVAGKGNIYNPEDFDCMVDIAAARKLGIRPLPLRVKTPGGYEIVMPAEAVDEGDKILPDRDEIDLDTPSKPGKKTLWERKLLDLTLRNNLVNVHTTTNCVQLVNADNQMVANALEQGDSFQVFGIPDDDWTGASIKKGIMVAVPKVDSLAGFAVSEIRDHRFHTFLDDNKTDQRVTAIRKAAKSAADFEIVVAKDTTADEESCSQYALHYLGRDEEALAWMDKIIESDPYDSGHWYDKACLYALMGREDDSVKALIEKYEAKLAEKIEKMNLKSVEETETRLTEVPITRHVGGTFNVDCTINGLPLSMIFDTGASDVTLSKVEADFMFKNNYISQDDIKGKKYYQVADGGITEGTVVTLKELKIGDAVLHNVDASVVKSQKAPLLLGESVMQKFGTFTVDNINNKLIIKH